MVDNNTKSERINIKLLEELDKMKFVNSRLSYSKRITILLEYVNIKKTKFNKWLEKKIKNGNK